MQKLIVLFCLFSGIQWGLADDPKTQTFISVVKKNFAKWDLDSNKELSLSEVNKAIVNPAIKGESAAAIVAIRRWMRGKTDPKEKIQFKDIEDRAKQTSKGKEGSNTSLNGMYNSALSKIQNADRRLFPQGPPKIESIHQGKLGDCFCLAPLGAMCYRDPESIQKMIQEVKNSNYKVKLGNKIVEVDGLTDSEIAYMASTEKSGIWINIYEKAVGKIRTKGDQTDDLPLIDVLTKGGSAGAMIEVITGNPIQRFSCSPFKKPETTMEKKEELLLSFRKMLQDAVQNKKLMTCGTGKENNVPGMLSNHAYGVLYYTKETDTLKIWNPHGQSFKPKGEPGPVNGYLTVDGIFDVKATDAVLIFSGFAFETEPKK